MVLAQDPPFNHPFGDLLKAWGGSEELFEASRGREFINCKKFKCAEQSQSIYNGTSCFLKPINCRTLTLNPLFYRFH